MRIGRRRWPVWLFDESAGGFAAWMGVRPTMQVDDLAELRSPTGWFEVRVVYVAQAEAEETAPGTDAPLYRLGLQRVRELEGRPCVEAGNGKSARDAIFSARTPLVAIAVVLAAVALTCLAALAVGWCFRAGQGQMPLSWAGSASGADGVIPKDALAVAARQMGMNDAQHKHVRRISEMTAQALQEVDALWKNDPPKLRAQKQMFLLRLAREEIFRALSAEQQQRWKWLVESSP